MELGVRAARAPGLAIKPLFCVPSGAGFSSFVRFGIALGVARAAPLAFRQAAVGVFCKYVSLGVFVHRPRFGLFVVFCVTPKSSV